MKICSKCKIEKAFGEFYKDKSRGDGLSYVCKKCASLKAGKYHAKNAEKTKQYRVKYRAENVKKIKESVAKYAAENAKKIKEHKAKYYAENPEKVNEQRLNTEPKTPSAA